MGYVFGQFMSDTDAGEVLRAYRESFVPSPLCPEPKTIVTIGAVCAETDEEARRLALAGGSLFRKEMPDGDAAPYSEHKLLVGTALSIRSKLQALAESYGVDEFMLVTTIPDYGKRLRSYELLAPIEPSN